MRTFLALLASALIAALAAPANAQDAATEAAQVDPHVSLYDAIQEAVDNDQIISNALAEAERQFALDPNIASLEAQSPGLIREMVKAMRPFIERMQTRLQAKYAPEMIATIKGHFTEAEAGQLAAFYRSETGKRFGTLLSQNFTVENSLEDATETSKITADQLERDTATTISRSMQALEPSDWASIMQATRDFPALTKMAGFVQATRPIRLRMENEPPTAEEQQMLEESFEAVFNARFPQ